MKRYEKLKRILIVASLGVLFLPVIARVLTAFLPGVNTQAIEAQSSQSSDQQKINKWFYIHQEYPNVIKQGGASLCYYL